MRNIQETTILDKVIQSRKEITDIVKKHWSNLTWCNVTDFDSGITFVLDSTNPRLANTKKAKEEIQVLSFKNWWTVVNVSDDYYSELLEIIQNFWLDDEKMGQSLQNKYGWVLSPYHSVRLYLFTDEKLVPIDNNIRKLNISEKKLFDSFMEKCSEEEKYEVYMDFEASFHNFYAYFVNEDIVAIGEFCKIHDDDIVVIPSIITREDCRWKWYWKAVVNAMTYKMLEWWFVPQYRCDPKNIASRKIAESLWYEEILNGYSLRMDK